jgi:hypothetical protein
MNRRALLVLALCMVAACWPAGGRAEGLREFKPGSLQQIKTRHAREPFLLVLWSVTCVPCRAEFEMLASVRDARGPFPLVLVATDGLDDRELARQMLEHYGMGAAENWIFADPDAQRLRFEIDPAWYGEMPRSYLYDATHAREAVSGGLERDRVEAWLAKVGYTPSIDQPDTGS